MLWWKKQGMSNLGERLCEIAVKRIQKYESRGFTIVGSVPPPEFCNLFKPWAWGQKALEQISTKYVDCETIIKRMHGR